MEKKSSRIMGEQSIANSFRGILRIGHISPLLYDKNGDIKSDKLYTITKEGKLTVNNSNGYYITQKERGNDGSKLLNLSSVQNTATNALSGNLNRYNESNTSIESIRINQVPLTDSLGNFLNWFVGESKVTIGSYISSNYPSLKSSTALIGLEAKQYRNNKEFSPHESGIVLNNSNSVIYVNNNYLHEDKDNNQNSKSINFKGKEQKEAEEEKKFFYRTKYTGSTSGIKKKCAISSYKANTEVIDGSYIHSKVEFKDIVQIIKDKIKEKIKDKLGNVPTGMVINQFCSLGKWFGEEQGYLPAMGKCREIPELDCQTRQLEGGEYNIQGACRKGINQVKNGDDIQVIPYYKRDYVLCDGSYYTLFTRKKTDDTFKTAQEQSFDRFIDLFYTIGYEYTTDLKRARMVSKKQNNSYSIIDTGGKVIDNNKITKCSVSIDNSNKKYLIYNGPLTTSDYTVPDGQELDRQTFFWQDLATMLAIRALYETIKEENYTITYNELRQKPIQLDKKYPILKYNTNSKNYYTDRQNNTVICKKLQDTIDYYVIESDGKSGFKATHQTGKICDIPQVKLFMYALSNKNVRSSTQDGLLAKYYTYHFQIPNLMKLKNQKGEAIGPIFIGSKVDGGSPPVFSGEITKNWVCDISADYIPHRHAIFKGRADTIPGGQKKNTAYTDQYNQSYVFIDGQYVDKSYKSQPNTEFKILEDEWTTDESTKQIYTRQRQFYTPLFFNFGMGWGCPDDGSDKQKWDNGKKVDKSIVCSELGVNTLQGIPHNFSYSGQWNDNLQQLKDKYSARDVKNANEYVSANRLVGGTNQGGSARLGQNTNDGTSIYYTKENQGQATYRMTWHDFDEDKMYLVKQKNNVFYPIQFPYLLNNYESRSKWFGFHDDNAGQRSHDSQTDTSICGSGLGAEKYNYIWGEVSKGLKYDQNTGLLQLEYNPDKNFINPRPNQINNGFSINGNPEWFTGDYRKERFITERDIDNYKNESTYWGIRHDQDIRFSNAEPNRGRTSLPRGEIRLQGSEYNTKQQDNITSWQTSDVRIELPNWFAPQSIKVLPLIKL